MTIQWTNVRIKLGDLQPWEHNPRQLSQVQGERLAMSLDEFGQVETIAIGPDMEVYNGHQRLAILLQQHGPAHEVDARQSSRPLTHDERRKLTVYLHEGATGDWDFEALGNLYEVDELVDWGFPEWKLDDVSWAADEEPQDDTGPQVDQADELRRKWGVELGQLWQLAEHRLICGDCTDATVVARVMGGEKVESLVFDPEWDAMPNAMTGFGDVLAFCDGATLGHVVERYGAPTWVFAWDCVTSWYTPNRPLRRMKLCLWYGDVTAYRFDGWHYGNAGEVRHVQNTRGDYVFQPDPRGKHLSDVFQEPITQAHSDGLHNHSKPVDWVTLLIANCTTGVVFDPFVGSGTSIIACEQLGRRCRACEIEPSYVAVTIQRWHEMTGQEPVLLDSGNL